jgi:SulP family sulfate permease
MLATLHRIAPAFAEWRGYDRGALRADVAAALTVAIVALPQSMAYALIAGVHPVHGLYSAIVAAIVGSFFGSSRHLITGPTNALALMVAGAMKGRIGQETFYPMLFLLTFLVGAIQFLMGVLKIGKIVNLVSHAVVVGFTAGAGMIIALGQVNEILGVTLPRGYHPLHEKVLLTFKAAGGANAWALGLALFTVAVIMLARRLDRRIPGALLALVLCAVLAGTLDLGSRGVRLVGNIPSHLPAFRMVRFDLGWTADLFGAALAIAVVGLVEAIAIAKSIALSSQQPIDANREFAGQGLANIASAFFGGFAGSGSFTRSALNHSAGGRTRLAGMLSGVFVAVTLVCLVSYARWIPAASLAGVIVMAAYSMVDQHAVLRIARASRHDLSVMLITAGATVAMPDLERAILTGIVLSVLIHVWHTGEIKVRLLRREGGSFREYDLDGHHAAGHANARVVIVHLDGDLYFGSATDLQDKLRQVAARTDAAAYVLRLKRVNVVDISAFEVVEAFVEQARARGRHVLFCGVSAPMARFLRKTGLADLVGGENILPAEETLYVSTDKAYARAVRLVESGQL